MICESCGFPFSENTDCALCIACLRSLKCFAFIEMHKLCPCGDIYCSNNTPERKGKAAELDAILKNPIRLAVEIKEIEDREKWLIGTLVAAILDIGAGDFEAASVNGSKIFNSYNSAGTANFQKVSRIHRTGNIPINSQNSCNIEWPRGWKISAEEIYAKVKNAIEELQATERHK